MTLSCAHADATSDEPGAPAGDDMKQAIACSVEARGTASWYGRHWRGRRTANGDRFDDRRLTAASLSLPLATHARVTNLQNGRWSLAVSLSEDEGATWPWTRHLELDSPTSDPQQRGEYHYPSIIQAKDGTLHASYSYFIPPAKAQKDDQGRLIRKAIKHAHFNEQWIRARP